MARDLVWLSTKFSRIKAPYGSILREALRRLRLESCEYVDETIVCPSLVTKLSRIVGTLEEEAGAIVAANPEIVVDSQAFSDAKAFLLRRFF